MPTPNLAWYSGVSESHAVSARCPYATVKACPRFFQSLSLLGEAGSTTIPKSEGEILLKYWKKSDLWPATREQATSVGGLLGNPSSFSKFCPEILYDRFQFFVTSLFRYSDEIDRDHAHSKLQAEGAPNGDPRWLWQHYEAQHYTECPVYSVLLQRTSDSRPNLIGDEPPWWRKHVAEIGTAVVVGGIGLLVKCVG